MLAPKVPRVVLGTMTFGTEGVGARIKDHKSVKEVLELFHQNGYDELDTARMYCSGNTEHMLGDLAVQANPPHFKLATKCYPTTPGDHEPKRLRQSLAVSLDALKTKRVDIFYLHAPDSGTPIERVLDGVQEAYNEGCFTELGLSNYMAWQVAEIYYLQKAKNGVLPTVYQGMYNALTRAVEPELFPCLRKLGIRFYEYNPLCGGFLTDRYVQSKLEETVVEEGSRFDTGHAQGTRYRERYWNDRYLSAVRIIQTAAREAGLTTAEIALRWVMHHSLLDGSKGDAVIIGASSLAQARENLESLKKGPLPESVLNAIDAGERTVKEVCPTYFRDGNTQNYSKP